MRRVLGLPVPCVGLYLFLSKGPGVSTVVLVERLRLCCSVPLACCCWAGLVTSGCGVVLVVAVGQRVTPELVFLDQIYSRARATIALFLQYDCLARSVRQAPGRRSAKCYPSGVIRGHRLCGTVTNGAEWVAGSHRSAPAASAEGRLHCGRRGGVATGG